MVISLIESLERIDIILASASPRRYELLKSLGLDFKVVPSNVEESHAPLQKKEEVVLTNARLKGLSVAEAYPRALVISADTIVVFEDEILGKPEDEADAFRMLQLLSGRTHQVYTAVGLFFEHYQRRTLDVVRTDVTFRALTDEEIWDYINTGEPFDKAGGYGIQGQGALLVDRIDGCYFNVVGFPLSRFFTMLTEFMKHFVV